MPDDNAVGCCVYRFAFAFTVMNKAGGRGAPLTRRLLRMIHVFQAKELPNLVKHCANYAYGGGRGRNLRAPRVGYKMGSFPWGYIWTAVYA